MSTKHTPQLMNGPFQLKIKAALDHDESNQYFLTDSNGFHLAQVFNCNGQFKESCQEAQANHVLKCVNLMPEMIEALDILLYKMPVTTQDWDKCKDLLKRAKGGVE